MIFLHRQPSAPNRQPDGQPRRKLRLLLAVAALLGAVVLAGCSPLGYYVQSVSGHLGILRAARPIDDWLADSSTPETLRLRLEHVRAMRIYASQQLGLPDNASYRSYADLHRPYAVWNVFAAPELSLQLKQWCFPITGCVSYRGYFNKADADAYAQTQRAAGLDVQVAGIPAYSTLGWTADPVLSTFINFPEGEVARLLFHELAHQVVYVAGDSTFNESFASTVEEEGVRRWLATLNDGGKLAEEYRLYATRRKAFVALLTRHRDALTQIYAGQATDGDKRRGKQNEFAALKADYAAMKDDSNKPFYRYNGYDRYFSQELNNSHLGAVFTYTRYQPAFTHLLQQEDGDFRKFYARVKEIGALAPPERTARLDALLAGPVS